MTRSEIYSVLNRVSNLDAELQIVNVRIQRMESTLQGHAIRYDVDKVQVSPSDRVADVMADMEKLLKRQAYLQRELLKSEQETADLIACLTDSKHRLVLTYRYIADLPWAAIATRMSYDERHVRRLRDEAVGYLSKNVQHVRKCP